MTQSRLFRIVSYVCITSFLLVLLVGLRSGSNELSSANKLTNYLSLNKFQLASTAPTAKPSGSGDQVPASNIPGQPVKGAEKPAADASKPADKPADTTKPADKAKPADTAKPADKAKPKATVTQAAKPKSEYVVKAGDKYSCIAEKYYGSYENYVEVMAANYARTVPGYSEYQLHVGAKLVLPALSAAQVKPATSLCK